MNNKGLGRFTLLLVMTIPFSLSAQKGPRLQITSGNNRFAIELYHSLAAKGGNIFVSPASVSMTLAMVYEGSRENTTLQMKEALHFLDDRETHRSEFSEWIKFLRDGTQDSSLILANALWTRSDFSIEKEMIDINRQYYSTGLQTVDFIGKSEESRKVINDWVEQRTRHKIKELLPAGSIDYSTVLVLTNAIYFKALWQNPFKQEKTKNENFYISKNESVNTSFMEQQGQFKYAENDIVSVLELPYTSGKYSMLIFLPKQDLEELQRNFTDDNYYYWIESMLSYDMTSVLIPKFKFENSTRLKEHLSNMGMPDAFVQGSANFSGISPAATCLQEIYHKAFIDVNEEGTEAAAATGAVVAQRSAIQKKKFHADHPFLFVIRDNTTNSILFIGRVLNPIQ